MRQTSVGEVHVQAHVEAQPAPVAPAAAVVPVAIATSRPGLACPGAVRRGLARPGPVLPGPVLRGPSETVAAQIGRCATKDRTVRVATVRGAPAIAPIGVRPMATSAALEAAQSAPARPGPVFDAQTERGRMQVIAPCVVMTARVSVTAVTVAAANGPGVPSAGVH